MILTLLFLQSSNMISLILTPSSWPRSYFQTKFIWWYFMSSYKHIYLLFHIITFMTVDPGSFCFFYSFAHQIWCVLWNALDLVPDFLTFCKYPKKGKEFTWAWVLTDEIRIIYRHYKISSHSSWFLWTIPCHNGFSEPVWEKYNGTKYWNATKWLVSF